MLRVGLTGGIASGKSTIMRMLAGLGCITVDADAIVARLYHPGEAGHEAIVRTYGAGVASSGRRDRSEEARRHRVRQSAGSAEAQCAHSSAGHPASRRRLFRGGGGKERG
jgi:dephospho-CoA kinase